MGECALIDLLPMELSMVEEEHLIEPYEGLQPGDEIVGDMSDYEKRLLTIAENLKEEYTSRKGELLGLLLGIPVSRQVMADLRRMCMKEETLRNVLMYGIMERFDLFGVNMGIRKGWKVVVYPSPPELEKLLT